MVTKEKFKTYLNIQKSGLTNMFDLNAVIFLSTEVYGVPLTRDDCLFIMKNYPRLRREYGGQQYEYRRENLQYR